jgi:hypothetical protein
MCKERPFIFVLKTRDAAGFTARDIAHDQTPFQIVTDSAPST